MVPWLAMVVIAGCGASAAPVQHSVNSACDTFHKWALEQPAGKDGTKDLALLAEAVHEAPRGSKVSADLSAIQRDAAKSSQGVLQEFNTVTAVAEAISDCLGR